MKIYRKNSEVFLYGSIIFLIFAATTAVVNQYEISIAESSCGLGSLFVSYCYYRKYKKAIRDI